MNNPSNKLEMIFDPLHGEIYFEENIKKIIDSLAFQRLRYIYQLGGANMVFPTTTHTRFSHSLGVYALACKLIAMNKDNFTAYEENLLKLSCLLHDIGHGPFSHAFENLTKISHEHFTKKMILEDSELNSLLKKINTHLPDDICKVLNKKYPNKVIVDLVSSNVDLDRLDYLLRDSFFSGISYGANDITWILRSMILNGTRLSFKANCVSAIENFIVSRYHMYKRLYLHSTAIARDTMIQKIIERTKDLFTNEYSFVTAIPSSILALLKCQDFSKMSIEEYSELNDFTLISFIFSLKKEQDPILNKLVDNFLRRKLFVYEELNENTSAKMKKIKEEFTPEERKYFYVQINTNLIPISNKVLVKTPILIHDKIQNKLVKIETISAIVKSLGSTFNTKINSKVIKIFYLVK